MVDFEISIWSADTLIYSFHIMKMLKRIERERRDEDEPKKKIATTIAFASYVVKILAKVPEVRVVHFDSSDDCSPLCFCTLPESTYTTHTLQFDTLMIWFLFFDNSV
jgi:hypothetical protein